LTEIPTLDILVDINSEQLEISDLHEHSLLIVLTPGIRNAVTTRRHIFFLSGACLPTAAIHALGQSFEQFLFDVFSFPGTEKSRKKWLTSNKSGSSERRIYIPLFALISLCPDARERSTRAH